MHLGDFVAWVLIWKHKVITYIYNKLLVYFDFCESGTFILSL